MTEPTPTTTAPTDRERPLHFHAERAILRFIGPELRTFAKGIVTGTTDANAVLAQLSGKLHVIEDRIRQGAKPANRTDLDKLIPEAPAQGSPVHLALTDAQMEMALKMRREGSSKRLIARQLGKQPGAVEMLLSEKGDPAPAEVLEREAQAARAAIATLQAKLNRLKAPPAPPAQG